MRGYRVALGVLLLLLGSCGMQPPSLVLSYTTEDPGPQMAAAVAEILAEQGFKVTLDDGFESTEELLAELESGNVDLGLLEEPLSPNPQLRMLMPVYPSVLHAVHSNNIVNPDLPALLAADPLFAGPPNSLGHRLVKELAVHYGVPGIDDRLLDTPWVPAPGPPPQAYLIFGGLLTPDARAGFINYQMFSFDNANSAAALALLYPNLRTFTLPGGIYPDLTDQSVATLAVETLLVARPTLDSEIAYTAVSALRAQPQKLEQAYPLSRATFANSIDHSIHTLALHDGAQRYINKDEPGFIERYAEVLALCATLLLAIGTMATTLLRSRNQRRKDRLDEYFLRLQDLRSDLHSQTDGGQTPAAISTAVSSLEGEVLDLLVEERLAVDSALVTFFLLSESVRREIDTTN